MHDRPRHTCATLFQEGRIEFRNQKALEAIALARIAELPEDDSCHFAEESFHNGIGYAYLKFIGLDDRDPNTDDYRTILELPDNPVDVFFLTRPTHPSLKDYEEWRSVEFVKRLSRHLGASNLNMGDYRIDEYEYEAFLAFLEGYQLVAQSVHSEQQEVSR